MYTAAVTGRYPREVNRVVTALQTAGVLKRGRENIVGAKSDEYVTNEQNISSNWLPFLSRIWGVLSSDLGSLVKGFRGISSVHSSRRRDDILNFVTVLPIHSSISLFTNHPVIRHI